MLLLIEPQSQHSWSDRSFSSALPCIWNIIIIIIIVVVIILLIHYGDVKLPNQWVLMLFATAATQILKVRKVGRGGILPVRRHSA